jgi:hypothetical protein
MKAMKAIPHIPSFNDFGSLTQDDLAATFGTAPSLERSWSINSEPSGTPRVAREPFSQSFSRAFFREMDYE